MDLAELHEKGIAHSQFTIVVLLIQQTVIVVSRVDQLLSRKCTRRKFKYSVYRLNRFECKCFESNCVTK